MAFQTDAREGRGAVVLGRWGEDRALVQMPGGAVATTDVPEHLRDTFDVGQHVTVTCDGEQLLACHPGAPLAALQYGAPRGRPRGIRGVVPPAAC